MTLVLLVDPRDAAPVEPLLPPDGPFAMAMRGLVASGSSAAIPDRVLLELYAYEIVERIRERLQAGRARNAVRIPLWPEAALAAADVEAHAARELQRMVPADLCVVRRAVDAADVASAMQQSFGCLVCDPDVYAASLLHDDPRDDVVRVAGVHLLRDDTLLLEWRSPDRAAYAGCWDTPGGKLEPGECAEDAARRECLEELGIELGELELLGIVDERDPTSGAVFRHHVLQASGFRGEPQARERQELRFVPRRGINEEETVAWLRWFR